MDAIAGSPSLHSGVAGRHFPPKPQFFVRREPILAPGFFAGAGETGHFSSKDVGGLHRAPSFSITPFRRFAFHNLLFVSVCRTQVGLRDS